MDKYNPDLDWYIGISHIRHVRPRCPFASVHRCPRFFLSLSLLGGAGSTRIEPKEEQRLLKKWKTSDLWPTTYEQSTSIMGEPGKPSIYSHFCPEVAYERFGLFAESLARYADEIDMDFSHKRLGIEGAAGNNWRWAWSHVEPMHYIECPLYSPLDINISDTKTLKDNQDAPSNFIQAVLRSIWNWKPIWRGVALTILIILVIAFTLWVSLPDRTKERFLDIFSKDSHFSTKQSGR